MDVNERDANSEALDPKDWTELRALAHHMDDDAFDDLASVPSYTTIHGTYCLRIAISNHRSTFADFDLFARTVVEVGAAISDELPV